MTIHSANDRLNKAHLCTCQFYWLELISALIYDCKDRVANINFEASTVDNIFTKTEDKVALNMVIESINNFQKSFELKLPEEKQLELKRGNYSQLIRKYKERGVIISKKIVICNEKHEEFDDYVIGPDRAISFGHYSSIFQIIRAHIMSEDLGVKQIYFVDANKEYSVYPNFGNIIKQLRNIQIIDMNKKMLSVKLLMSYHKSGGTEGTRNKLLKKAFKNFKVNSDVAYCSDKEDNEMLRLKNVMLAKTTSLLETGLNKITQNNSIGTNKEIFRMIKKSSQHPIICIANRDEQFTGGNQPWRDSDINKYYLLAEKLISEGFQVCRINTVGKSIGGYNQNLLDLTTLDNVHPHEQFNIIKNCKAFIGCSTGITEYATQLLFTKTLIIDSSVITNTGIEPNTIHIPKKLIIEETSRFERIEKMDLIQLVLRKCWTYHDLKLAGLGLKELTDREISDSASAFIKNKMRTKSIYELLEEVNVRYRIKEFKIDESTYNNLINLFTNKK